MHQETLVSLSLSEWEGVWGRNPSAVTELVTALGSRCSVGIARVTFCGLLSHQSSVENEWLAMDVLCLLLRWPHVINNISIYTHAQGSKCENEQGLLHSAEMNFKGSAIKLTLDLHSLWHKLNIFYQGEKKYILLPTLSSYCLTWSISIQTGLQSKPPSIFF